MTSTGDASARRMLERQKIARYAETPTADLCDTLEILQARAEDVTFDGGRDPQNLNRGELFAHEQIRNELERRHRTVGAAVNELLATTDGSMKMSQYIATVVKAAREDAQ